MSMDGHASSANANPQSFAKRGWCHSGKLNNSFHKHYALTWIASIRTKGIRVLAPPWRTGGTSCDGDRDIKFIDKKNNTPTKPSPPTHEP